MINESVEFDLQYSNVEIDQDAVPVVIVAAGASRRMRCGNKQLAQLLGIPVIAHTMRAFENCRKISSIILVTREDMIAEIQGFADEYNIKKLTGIVLGGKTRAESVKIGIDIASKTSDHALVHDGARPLVSAESIIDTFSLMMKYGAATCAVPTKDTIKIVSERGVIKETPKRTTTFSCQTPQGFSTKNYYIALDKNGANYENFTDDCGMLEEAGIEVYISKGNYKNIKITTDEDLLTAETFLKVIDDL